jgi:hypothetical protein
MNNRFDENVITVEVIKEKDYRPIFSKIAVVLISSCLMIISYSLLKHLHANIAASLIVGYILGRFKVNCEIKRGE